MTPLRIPILLVTGLLVLGACGGSDEASDDTAVSTDVVTAMPTDTDATEPTEPTEPAVAEPAATEPVVTEPAVAEPVATEPAPDTAAPGTAAPEEGAGASGSGGGDDADCLIGDWVVTEEQMNAYYDALEANLGGGPAPTFDITGQVLLTFTETDYVYTGDFDLALAIAGQEGTGSSAGTASGTWTATDGVITTELGESNLSVTVDIGGITFDGDELANGLLTDLPINAAPYDCAGPTIDFLAGTGAPRHPVTLTPA